ncbi:nucleotidyltransferase domain-containing protein [Bacillus safensis]|uniref:nucleotidyltransferase domain-containing protein n=1 Tax=Bacillus safensis TaxID=561879 RepID=UPI0022829B63|nr:nucleotidyltransferase domain-containing protein [Bacillus safensis]MCY7542395.1 nucleotidyltransferase domain-containing protein [Bacillus safensis]MCY7552847.1 nucleotidyltransferase domain-containing protein [Bacillus safensis]MCY7644701.1 nucleotidyltransferase domain-containing protein [Bacillus safensis]MCY7655984.1 nucleotidyltransferase domain-containing protein [Bacillus safensis]MEC3710459.1 nucleotidyltransferase domain-containing protein [Bacillus safensis]
MSQLKVTSNINWLDERTIILAPTGSYAYGTNTAESDKDFKGICIPPKEYYLGLESFNEYNNSGGKNFKNSKDDVDINIIHINKFVKDAMEGVPNNIELLFVRDEDYLKVTNLGQKLIDNRHLFLTKNIQKKFGGYAHSQMQKLKNTHSNGAARKELVDAHGYDTKFFMHSIRLLTSAIEILKTGDFSTFRPNREFLIDCRSGKFSFEEALQMIENYDQELKDAVHASGIPERPDYETVNRLLIELNEEALEKGVN